MATWNEFREDVSRVASKAVKKTGELADSASIHIKLKLIDTRLGTSFEKLGKLTYKQLKDGESQAEKISEVIATIDSLRADQKTLKIKLEEIKEAKEKEKAESDLNCEE